jgi:hypothetical protein
MLDNYLSLFYLVCSILELYIIWGYSILFIVVLHCTCRIIEQVINFIDSFILIFLVIVCLCIEYF